MLNNLTIKQHIRSKSCIKRFGDASGHVAILRLGGTSIETTGPASQWFCAMRAWDQRLEHSKWTTDIEGRFRHEVEAIIQRKERVAPERDDCRFFGFGIGVMNSARRRRSTICWVGWPDASSSQCRSGRVYGELSIGFSKN